MIRITVHTLPELSLDQLTRLHSNLERMSKDLPFLKPVFENHLKMIRSAMENKVPTTHENQINDIMKEVEQNAIQKEVERQRKEWDEIAAKQLAEIEKRNREARRFDRFITIASLIAAAVIVIVFFLLQP